MLYNILVSDVGISTSRCEDSTWMWLEHNILLVSARIASNISHGQYVGVNAMKKKTPINYRKTK